MLYRYSANLAAWRRSLPFPSKQHTCAHQIPSQRLGAYEGHELSLRNNPGTGVSSDRRSSFTPGRKSSKPYSVERRVTPRPGILVRSSSAEATTAAKIKEGRRVRKFPILGTMVGVRIGSIDCVNGRLVPSSSAKGIGVSKEAYMLPPHDSLSVRRHQLVRGMVPGGIFSKHKRGSRRLILKYLTFQPGFRRPPTVQSRKSWYRAGVLEVEKICRVRAQLYTPLNTFQCNSYLAMVAVPMMLRHHPFPPMTECQTPAHP